MFGGGEVLEKGDWEVDYEEEERGVPFNSFTYPTSALPASIKSFPLPFPPIKYRKTQKPKKEQKTNIHKKMHPLPPLPLFLLQKKNPPHKTPSPLPLDRRSLSVCICACVEREEKIVK